MGCCDLCHCTSYFRSLVRCRLCGRIVCKSCAETQIKTGIFRTERICSFCFDARDALQNEEALFLRGMPRRTSVASAFVHRGSVVSSSAASDAGYLSDVEGSKKRNLKRSPPLANIYSGVMLSEENVRRVSQSLEKANESPQMCSTKPNTESQSSTKMNTESQSSTDTQPETPEAPRRSRSQYYRHVPLGKHTPSMIQMMEEDLQRAMNSPIPDSSGDDWSSPDEVGPDDEGDDENIVPSVIATVSPSPVEDKDGGVFPLPPSPLEDKDGDHASQTSEARVKYNDNLPASHKLPESWAKCNKIPPMQPSCASSPTSFRLDERKLSLPTRIQEMITVKRKSFWVQRFAAAEGPFFEYRKKEYSHIRCCVRLPEVSVQYLGHVGNGYCIALMSKQGYDVVRILLVTKDSAENWFRALWWGSCRCGGTTE